MFENDLQTEKRTLDTLKRKLSDFQSRYLKEAESLKKQYDKTNGMAEKEIDKTISSLQNEMDKICRDLQKQLDKNLEENKNSVAHREETALKQINSYRNRCENDFKESALSMMIFKGEL